jgi:hypothetical protein
LCLGLVGWVWGSHVWALSIEPWGPWDLGNSWGHLSLNP